MIIICKLDTILCTYSQVRVNHDITCTCMYLHVNTHSSIIV